jgi:hypothetical protein
MRIIDVYKASGARNKDTGISPLGSECLNAFGTLPDSFDNLGDKRSKWEAWDKHNRCGRPGDTILETDVDSLHSRLA